MILPESSMAFRTRPPMPPPPAPCPLGNCNNSPSGARFCTPNLMRSHFRQFEKLDNTIICYPINDEDECLNQEVDCEYCRN